jgi:SAM-dependent methyltransferase
MSDARALLVAEGYDAMADAWQQFAAGVSADPRLEWLGELVARTPADGTVVELGCGNGTPETAELARRFDLTAVDLSCEQLRRAQARVPKAKFVHADLLEVEFAAGSLDAVAAFYVFNHVPRELLAGLFARIHGWLRPGGHLLASFGCSDDPGWHGEWLGVPMYFSSFPPGENARLLTAAGFVLVRDEVVAIEEPEPSGSVEFQWILARR